MKGIWGFDFESCLVLLPSPSLVRHWQDHFNLKDDFEVQSLGAWCMLIPSRKSFVYQRFISISSYYICYDLPVSITIASIDTNFLLIYLFSADIKQISWVQQISAMASRFHIAYTQPWQLEQVQKLELELADQTKESSLFVYYNLNLNSTVGIRLTFFSSCFFPSHRTLQCCLYSTISVFLLDSVRSIWFCGIHLARGLSPKIIICDRSQRQWDWMLLLPYVSYWSL